MKYIDADKLIKFKEALADIIVSAQGICTYQDCKDIAEREALLLIATLQQEQPFPRWIHANYSDKPEIRYTPSGIPYLQNGSYMIWLSDLDTLPKDGKDLTNPIQEQPEVDLEKEIEEWIIKGREDFELEGWVTAGVDCIARHFYELGLNARKEE